MRLHLSTNILHSFPFLLKVQGHGGTPFHTPAHYSPAPQYTMPNTYLDKAIAAIPKFEERISLFWENFVWPSMPTAVSTTTV